jgi:hypothetical protein
MTAEAEGEEAREDRRDVAVLLGLFLLLLAGLVSGLFLFVTLLVSSGLGLIRSALLLVQGLPLLAEHLADLAYT